MYSSAFRRACYLGLVMAVALPTWAHHSVSGQFIAQDEVLYRVAGVVSNIQWVQPHIYFYVAVEQADGSTVTHELETYPPGFFRRYGLNRASFEVGQTISFDVWPARDGTPNLGWIKVMHFDDGRSLALHSDSPGARIAP